MPTTGVSPTNIEKCIQISLKTRNSKFNENPFNGSRVASHYMRTASYGKAGKHVQYVYNKTNFFILISASKE
jgi:hypothetical protein